jgi:hypothetical protein
MFKVLSEFLKKHFVIIIGCLALCAFAYNSYKDFTNPPELREFKGSIQNHLIWSIKGECYFVRPHNGSTVYLIRVEDCDKK